MTTGGAKQCPDWELQWGNGNLDICLNKTFLPSFWCECAYMRVSACVCACPRTLLGGEGGRDTAFRIDQYHESLCFKNPQLYWNFN